MDSSEKGAKKEDTGKEQSINGMADEKTNSNEAESGGASAASGESAQPQQPETEHDNKRPHPGSTEEDEAGKKKKARKEEPPTTPRSKNGSTSGGNPKSATGADSDGEGPKVPPLKIVIPPREQEGDTGTGRNGASGLQYIVASSDDAAPSSPPAGSTEESNLSEEQQKSQRVLCSCSCHRDYLTQNERLELIRLRRDAEMLQQVMKDVAEVERIIRDSEDLSLEELEALLDERFPRLEH